jgi:predicted TPR repeat methyltransferase
VSNHRGGGGGGVGVELVTAADVLVYFGELYELLDTLSRLSAPLATLIVSCERASDAEAPDGWMLRASGRFAHTRSYVVGAARAAGGYELQEYEEIVPRMEYGQPVLGHLFVFSRHLQ